MSRGMQRFWDARARENPWFFVDNRVRYDDPDVDRFWADGERAVDGLLEAVGARIEPGDVVVDVGCGVGRLTRVIAARAAEVVAVDVSPQMLKRAREHNSQLDNVRWVRGDGTTLAGIPDASADACVSHVVFQHIPDPAVTLGYVREMGRVLRPGGWAAFQVSNDVDLHRPERWRRSLRDRLRTLVRRAPRGQADPRWLGSAIDLEALRAAAEEAGMSVERVVNPGTQFCFVLTRRRGNDPPSPVL